MTKEDKLFLGDERGCGGAAGRGEPENLEVMGMFSIKLLLIDI